MSFGNQKIDSRLLLPTLALVVILTGILAVTFLNFEPNALVLLL